MWIWSVRRRTWMQVEVKSTHSAPNYNSPPSSIPLSNHTRAKKQPAQILCRIHILCHRLLKTAPPSLATSLPAPLLPPVLPLPGLLHGYAPFRAFKACVVDKAHGSPHTSLFLHPLLSPLGEAKPSHSVTVLRYSSRLNLSMLRRRSDR